MHGERCGCVSGEGLEIRRSEMAALAARVLKLEDPAAKKIVFAAAEELILSVRAVLTAARIEAASPKLVFSGGLLEEGRVLRGMVEDRLARDLPSIRIVRGRIPAPTIGVARLARVAWIEAGSLG